MPYSSNTTVATGTSAQVSVPFGYLAKSHVHVTLDGDAIADNLLSWTSTSTITLPYTPPPGTVIRVYRETPAQVNEVVWSNDLEFDAKDLNRMQRQILYVAQEAIDGSRSALDVTDSIQSYLLQITQLYEQAVDVQNQVIADAAQASASKSLSEQWATSLDVVAGGLRGARYYAQVAQAITDITAAGVPIDTIEGIDVADTVQTALEEIVSILSDHASDISDLLSRSITAGGLVAITPDGDIGAGDITISVPKADTEEAEAGTDDSKAMTPKTTKEAVLAHAPSPFTTGDIKLTLKTTADSGWRMFDDGTIGNQYSGATYANDTSQALFTLLFNNLNDTNAPILTSAGSGTTRSAQTDAATAWTNNCRLSLPKTLGRALAIAGAGSGLTSRQLGSATGEEAHTLTASEQASMPVTGSFSGSAAVPRGSGGGGGGFTEANSIGSELPATATGTITGTATGGGSAHNNMQPTVFLNVMVKL